jgi:hypothetical protein
MEDKITIIEGPPPTFEAAPDGWSQGLSEGPLLSGIVRTRLRTFNGPSLVERCHTAWRNKAAINLEFKTPEGLKEEAQIVAARNLPTDEGDVLMLWVRLPDDGLELEIGYEDELGEDGEPGEEVDMEGGDDEEEDDFDLGMDVF